MSVLRRFLTPGWVVGLLTVVAFAYACFTVLAPWQLGKSDRLDERNHQLVESVRAQPVSLDSLLTDPSPVTADEWRLVTAEGSYVPGSDVLLRLRTVDGDLVYQVLAVFRAADGREYLVNRGHVPVGENNAVPPYPAPPGGPVTITARLRSGETGGAEPISLSGHRAVRSIDLTALGALIGRPVDTRGYLQLTGDQPGVLAPMPIPAVENGPYLSYGLQWIAFGVLAPLGLAYFAWSEISARRRDAAAATASAQDRSGAPPPGVEPEEPDADELVARAQERALRERYGNRHDAERTRARRRRDRLSDG